LPEQGGQHRISDPEEVKPQSLVSA